MSISDSAASSGGTVDKRTVLVVGSAANFLGALMLSSINIAIPSIGAEFEVDAVLLSWTVTAYVLTVAIFMVPAGRLADVYGRKKVFLCGLALWSAVSLLCGLAISMPMLIAFRALMGIGAAMVFSTAMAIVTSAYPAIERGRALGINVAAVYTGMSIGPTFGGIMTQHVGWRSLFFLNVTLGTCLVILTLWKVRSEWAEAKGQKLDVTGVVIFAATLSSLMYGFSLLPQVTGATFIAIGLACLVCFIAWENRVASPLIDMRLFRHNLVFALSNLSALLNFAATAGIAFLMSLYLQYVRGLDPQTAGLIILAQPITQVVFAPLAGRLSDRIEPRILATLGMAITVVGLLLIAMIDHDSTLAYIFVTLLVAGLGLGLFSPPNSSAALGSVDRSSLGVASGILGLMRNAGQMLSMGVVTVIIAVYVGQVQITPAYHASFASGFRLAFFIFAGLCVIGVFTSLARGNMRSEATVGETEERYTTSS